MSANIKTIIFFILFSISILNATTVSEVEKNIMCTCDCTMALYTCECGTSDQMRAEIQSMINKGMDKDQIVTTYVNRYGEQILSAPTKKGFNLTAWLMPFLAILVVGAVLYQALRRWSTHTVPKHETLLVEKQSEYNVRLQQELDKFEEGELL